MIRSNSKKAIQNIRNYIIDNFDPEAYGLDEIIKAMEDNAAGIRNVDIWSMVKEQIKATVYAEKIQYDTRHMSRQQLFTEWCQGLPSLLDTCYYSNRSAVDDLAAILEETEEEKNRFTEEQAEEKITWLMFREIYK